MDMQNHLFNLFFLIDITAFTALCVYLVLDKPIGNRGGIIDLYETHRKKWMPKRCNFCLLFWISCPIAAVLIYSIPFHFVYLITPFPSAALAVQFVYRS